MAIPPAGPFPTPLDLYPVPAEGGLLAVLAGRVAFEPFNAAATAVFALAIIHTFAVKRFLVWAHHLQEAHDAHERAGGRPPSPHVGAELLHFVGEIEAVFGIWAIVLILLITYFHGWTTAQYYLSHRVDYTEPLFVFVIMALAATRPIVTLAETLLRRVAALGGATPAAWWLTILTLGPLLGSFITEPAAMTICALLLGRQLYALGPSRRLAYATDPLGGVGDGLPGALSSRVRSGGAPRGVDLTDCHSAVRLTRTCQRNPPPPTTWPAHQQGLRRSREAIPGGREEDGHQSRSEGA